VLQLLNKRGGAFTNSDEDLALVLNSLIGVAIQRQLLLDEYAEKQRIVHDLSIAREIQQSLLPESAPQLENFDIAGWNEPANETGGDCYDFIELDADRVVILLADATGHGVGPALIASECRALIRALASVTDDTAEILHKANDILRGDLSPGRFLTAFVGLLDARNATLTYVSAGQAPLLVLSSGFTERTVLEANTAPLGIIPFFSPPEVSRLEFQPDDLFILLSDGFFEWQNPSTEEFGVDRTFDHFASHSSQTCEDAIVSLYDAVLTFSEGIEQSDDLTAVLIRRIAG
jgi:phosphoserine phosphatase